MMPRPRLLGLFGVGALLLFAGAAYPPLTAVGLLGCLAIAFLALVDLTVSPRLSRVEVLREVGAILSVGARNAVHIWVRNRNRHPLTIRIHDEYPQPAEARELPIETVLPPGKTRQSTWHIVPGRRGDGQFGRIYLECASRWGFWTLHDERPHESQVKIYPDIQAVSQMELLARRNRLAEAGIRMSRLRGRGSEFDRLREYRRADELRQIDWKATARRQELISREYVVEKNQQILFLLDCGRSMCNADGGIRHFDRALNAMILLAHIALKQGDTVSVLGCSNRVDRWVAPLRGDQSVRRLVRLTYDLEPSYEASDYALMAEEVRRRNRKRSLVVLLTHVLDEVHLTTIAQQLRLLRQPHLVLGAFLTNVPLHDRLDELPEDARDAFQIAAAADMLGQQSRQIAELQQLGLLVLESRPDQLTGDLISHYMDIKARHLL